jgi:hypothetical protein
LRARDEESRRAEMEALVNDLKRVKSWIVNSAASLTARRAS